MASLSDVMYYLVKNYPYPEDLTNGRLTKLVYLADWRNCIETGEQLTKIKWYFDNFGPFVWDIKEHAEANPLLFKVGHEVNYYGSPKTSISVKNIKTYSPSLSVQEINVLDRVIRVTGKRRTWSSFVEFVYSTFPIMHCPRYSSLDLPELVKIYKASKSTDEVD